MKLLFLDAGSGINSISIHDVLFCWQQQFKIGSHDSVPPMARDLFFVYNVLKIAADSHHDHDLNS
jgi:hypothetical protein